MPGTGCVTRITVWERTILQSTCYRPFVWFATSAAVCHGILNFCPSSQQLRNNDSPCGAEMQKVAALLFPTTFWIFQREFSSLRSSSSRTGRRPSVSRYVGALVQRLCTSAAVALSFHAVAMQTVNRALRNAKTLKLHSAFVSHAKARRSEPPLAIRHHSKSLRLHHPQRVRSEPNSQRCVLGR